MSFVEVNAVLLFAAIVSLDEALHGFSHLEHLLAADSLAVAWQWYELLRFVLA